MIFLCVVHNLGAPRSGKNEWSGSSRTMTRRAFSGRACFSWSQTTHCFYISITSRGLIQCLKQTVCHLHAILSHQSLTSSHHTKWRGVKTSQVKFALVTEHIHTTVMKCWGTSQRLSTLAMDTSPQTALEHKENAHHVHFQLSFRSARSWAIKLTTSSYF